MMLRKSRKITLSIFAAFFASPVLADVVATTQENLDMIWIIVSVAMVFFMQAGFTALETGMIRAKNSINVAIKNVSDMIVTVLSFWAVGFALMFGAAQHGLFGTTGFFLDEFSSAYSYVFFIFHGYFRVTRLLKLKKYSTGYWAGWLALPQVVRQSNHWAPLGLA